MARINLDDSLFKTKRFFKLSEKLGSQEKALGCLMFAWIHAQRFWAPDKKPIPFDVWAVEELNDHLIGCGFAKKIENGVYLKGSKDQFAWLIQCHEAGKLGGRPRKNPPVQTDKCPKPSETGLNPSKPSTSTSTSTLSPSLNKRVESQNDSTSPAVQSSSVVKARPGSFDAIDQEDVLRSLSGQTLMRWSGLYPDVVFLKRESVKAIGYYFDNPRKKPKTARGWAQALSSWFEKSWARSATFTKGAIGSSVDWSQVFGGTK